MTATLATPQINSIPVADGESNVIQGFRFMGQRFSMDATVMQKLVYSNVGANSQGEKRMLPDILDVPAALGSNMALNILEEEGAMDYEGYSENMELLKEGLSQENETLWSASLYAGFTMITMLLGSYFYNASPVFGKTLWFIGLILHAIHMFSLYRSLVTHAPSEKPWSALVFFVTRHTPLPIFFN